MAVDQPGGKGAGTRGEAQNRPKRDGTEQEAQAASSVAKIIEISAQSPESFEAAIRNGLARASKTLKGVKSAWVKEQSVDLDEGRITTYRVNLMVTFVLND